MSEHDPYTEVAVDLPNLVTIGGALITMVQPHTGRENDYNRWYEDDHFYAGAMAGPWTFSGRRYVAPRALRQNRMPASSPIADPLDSGSFISLYWVTGGHLDDNVRWSMAAMYDSLTPQGRGNPNRDHVYTAFHDFAFERVFDPAPMKSIHALDHPYPGLVVEVIGIDEGVDRTTALGWLRDEFVAGHDGSRSIGQCVAFTPIALEPAVLAGIKTNPVDMSRCVCLLWFLGDDPATSWPGVFAQHESRLVDSGLVSLLLAAPFVPTLPGTNRYLDEL